MLNYPPRYYPSIDFPADPFSLQAMLVLSPNGLNPVGECMEELGVHKEPYFSSSFVDTYHYVLPSLKWTWTC